MGLRRRWVHRFERRGVGRAGRASLRAQTLSRQFLEHALDVWRCKPRLRQDPRRAYWGPARKAPESLFLWRGPRPSPVRARINSRSNSASPPSTASISRKAHGGVSDAGAHDRARRSEASIVRKVLRGNWRRAGRLGLRIVGQMVG
jgi:hypothetical protein